jgi:hypothetical protein
MFDTYVSTHQLGLALGRQADAERNELAALGQHSLRERHRRVKHFLELRSCHLSSLTDPAGLAGC